MGSEAGRRDGFTAVLGCCRLQPVDYCICMNSSLCRMADCSRPLPTLVSGDLGMLLASALVWRVMVAMYHVLQG